jgi:hypothetical protein
VASGRRAALGGFGRGEIRRLVRVLEFGVIFGDVSDQVHPPKT